MATRTRHAPSKAPRRPKSQVRSRKSKLDALTSDPQNANKGTSRGRELVADSVRNYGVGRPILVDKHRRVIAGNKTLKGAQAAGITKIKYVRTRGDTLIVHQRDDLDLAKDSRAKELAVVDNRSSEVGLEWSTPVLQAFADADVNLKKAGFSESELASLFGTGDEQADTIPEMELRPFEHHDYLVVVFTNSQDWAQACELLNIQREAATVGSARKIGLGRVIAADRLLAIVQATKTPARAKRS